MRFDGANDIAFIVWNDVPGMHSKVSFSQNELLSVNNIFGESMSAEQDELILEETIGPAYLRLRRR
jgi:hypothetical protein